MGNKGREVPRVVCCAIPLASAAGKVLVITSRKRQDLWVCASLSCPPPSLPLSAISSFVCVDPWSLTIGSSLSPVPKGGYEVTDGVLEAAASREALEEGLTLCPSTRHLIS